MRLSPGAAFLLICVLGCSSSPRTSDGAAESSKVATRELEAEPTTPEREPPPKPVDLSGYDLTCSKDEDCAVVHNQPCAKCGCADTPISAKEFDRAREAIAAVKCPPDDPWPGVDCGACMPMEPYCEAGQCKAR